MYTLLLFLTQKSILQASKTNTSSVSILNRREIKEKNFILEPSDASHGVPPPPGNKFLLLSISLRIQNSSFVMV
jgi:hypothetical protein